MTRQTVTLLSPPADLTGFPVLSARATPGTLYRIAFLRDRTTGAYASPWRFSAVPPGASRFDLPAPDGTCYWSDRAYGCWVEVWRGTRVVDRADVTRRTLFSTTPPALRLADTLAPRAHRYGVTGELSVVVPYGLPQAWAQALRTHGFAGLVGACRHDPALTARTFAVFGPGGVVARRAGWRTRRSALLDDLQLVADLTDLGVQVAAVPHTVPITPPV